MGIIKWGDELNNLEEPLDNEIIRRWK